MNGWDNLKNYEGRVTIPFTTGSLTGRILETRDKLDRWLAILHRPPKNMAQALRLVKLTGHDVTYELSLRNRADDEPRMILED